jgi:hypothetical protein
MFHAEAMFYKLNKICKYIMKRSFWVLYEVPLLSFSPHQFSWPLYFYCLLQEDLRGWADLWLHRVRTEFHENWSVGAKLKRKCVHSHRARWSRKSAFSPYENDLFYLWFIQWCRSCLRLHCVTWRLKAGMVEPEQTFIATQRLGNHVSAAKNINKG